MIRTSIAVSLLSLVALTASAQVPVPGQPDVAMMLKPISPAWCVSREIMNEHAEEANESVGVETLAESQGMRMFFDHDDCSYTLSFFATDPKTGTIVESAYGFGKGFRFGGQECSVQKCMTPEQLAEKGHPIESLKDSEDYQQWLKDVACNAPDRGDLQQRMEMELIRLFNEASMNSRER